MSRRKNGQDTEELLTMITEIALRAEIEHRQQRFLDEAQAYRLAKQARSAAPRRTHQLASVLRGLTQRRARRARTQHVGSQRATAADRRGSACAA
jgi:hypothetical protein